MMSNAAISAASTWPSSRSIRLHRAQQVLGVNHADDVLGLVALERQAGVRGFQALAQDVGDRQVGVDHLDARSGAA